MLTFSGCFKGKIHSSLAYPFKEVFVGKGNPSNYVRIKEVKHWPRGKWD